LSGDLGRGGAQIGGAERLPVALEQRQARPRRPARAGAVPAGQSHERIDVPVLELPARAAFIVGCSSTRTPDAGRLCTIEEPRPGSSTPRSLTDPGRHGFVVRRFAGWADESSPGSLDKERKLVILSQP
jgi:hypothetical protein